MAHAAAKRRAGELVRRRVRHYMRDLREDVGYALFIFSAKDGTLVGGLTLCNVRRGVTQACTLGFGSAPGMPARAT